MTNTPGWVWAKTDTKMKRSKPNVTWNEGKIARTIRSSQWNSWDMFLICSISYCFIHPALPYSLLHSSNCPFPWFIAPEYTVILILHFPIAYCFPMVKWKNMDFCFLLLLLIHQFHLCLSFHTFLCGKVQETILPVYHLYSSMFYSLFADLFMD
jgi:hypothetical protein